MSPQVLTPAQKHALLDLAREAVHARVAGGTRSGRARDRPAGRVRRVRDDQARRRAARMSRDAAIRMDRSPMRSCAARRMRRPGIRDSSRVSVAELPDLSLEVSVLGPLEPIDPTDAAAVAIGRHGLVVEQGHRRGLLLPQVATEWGWTVDAVPAADVRQGRPGARCVAARGPHLALRRRSVRRVNAAAQRLFHAVLPAAWLAIVDSSRGASCRG